MAFFASARERRLWLATLAMAAAIFATLGLAGLAAGALRDLGLLEAALFLALILLVGATVILHGLKAPPAGEVVAVALGVATVYLLLFYRLALEERSHLIEYGVLAVFVHAALAERARGGRHVPQPAALAVLATVALGLLDECLQLFLPNRVFDPWDILFNALAASLAVAASQALAWAERRTTRRRARGR